MLISGVMAVGNALPGDIFVLNVAHEEEDAFVL